MVSARHRTLRMMLAFLLALCMVVSYTVPLSAFAEEAPEEPSAGVEQPAEGGGEQDPPPAEGGEQPSGTETLPPAEGGSKTVSQGGGEGGETGAGGNGEGQEPADGTGGENGGGSVDGGEDTVTPDPQPAGEDMLDGIVTLGFEPLANVNCSVYWYHQTSSLVKGSDPAQAVLRLDFDNEAEADLSDLVVTVSENEDLFAINKVYNQTQVFVYIVLKDSNIAPATYDTGTVYFSSAQNDWSGSRASGSITVTQPAPTGLAILDGYDHGTSAANIEAVAGETAYIDIDILPDAPNGAKFIWGTATVDLAYTIDGEDALFDVIDASAFAVTINKQLQVVWDEGEGGKAVYQIPTLPFESTSVDIAVTPGYALAGKTVSYTITVHYDSVSYGGTGVLSAQGTIKVNPPAGPTISAAASLDFGTKTVGQIGAPELWTTFQWSVPDSRIGNMSGLVGMNLVSVSDDFEIVSAWYDENQPIATNQVTVRPKASLGIGLHTGTLTLTLPSSYGAGIKWTKTVPLSINVVQPAPSELKVVERDGQTPAADITLCPGQTKKLTVDIKPDAPVEGQPYEWGTATLCLRFWVDGFSPDNAGVSVSFFDVTLEGLEDYPVPWSNEGEASIYLDRFSSETMDFNVTPGAKLAGRTVTYEISVYDTEGIDVVSTTGTITVAADHAYGAWDDNETTGTGTRTCTRCGHTETRHFPTGLLVATRGDYKDARDITLIHGDTAELTVDILPDAPVEGSPYLYGNASITLSWWVKGIDVPGKELAVNITGLGPVAWGDISGNGNSGGVAHFLNVPFTSEVMDFAVTPSEALAGLDVHYDIQVTYDNTTYGGKSRLLTTEGVIHVTSPEPVIYPVLEDFGTWSGAGTLTARVGAQGDTFVLLSYQGNPVAEDNYDVTTDGAFITLHADYLATFAAGTHMLLAEFESGVSAPITLVVPAAVAGGVSGGSGDSGSSGQDSTTGAQNDSEVSTADAEGLDSRVKPGNDSVLSGNDKGNPSDKDPDRSASPSAASRNESELSAGSGGELGEVIAEPQEPDAADAAHSMAGTAALILIAAGAAAGLLLFVTGKRRKQNT
jgi:hypothetical protein